MDQSNPNSIRRAPAHGHESLYEVDELGRVWSLYDIEGVKSTWDQHWAEDEVAPFVRANTGQVLVYLYESKSSRKAVPVSRLVAGSFLNPDGLADRDYIVRHKDENRLNNSVANLEVVPVGSLSRASHQTNGGRICEVNGCEEKAKARGFCTIHYSRWHRYGSPTAEPKRQRRRRTAEHGTPGGYSNDKCRCDDCRLAWNSYCAEQRREARRREKQKTRRHEPVVDGKACSCSECKRFRSEMNRFRTLKPLRPSDRSRLVEEQEGRCAICCEVPRRLVVDHIHGTSLVRGLLCDRCNSGIGKLGDTIEGLERAVEYLRRPPVFDAGQVGA